jgi:hypothetical protein
MSQNRLQNIQVVTNTELVRDGQQQGIGCGDRVVFSELFDEHIRLGWYSHGQKLRAYHRYNRSDPVPARPARSRGFLPNPAERYSWSLAENLISAVVAQLCERQKNRRAYIFSYRKN